jgi:four helix bundle protein
MRNAVIWLESSLLRQISRRNKMTAVIDWLGWLSSWMPCCHGIGANLEEAAAGQTKPDFTAKVCISRKEARETVYWLRLLAATGLVCRDELAGELNEAEQLVAILGSIVFKARLSAKRGFRQ